jgi:hypothetical protein
MHIEADKHPAAAHAMVYLDGQKIMLCVWADEEAGELCCYKTGPDGKPVHNGQEWQTEILRGTVRVELPPELEHLRHWK